MICLYFFSVLIMLNILNFHVCSVHLFLSKLYWLLTVVNTRLLLVRKYLECHTIIFFSARNYKVIVLCTIWEKNIKWFHKMFRSGGKKICDAEYILFKILYSNLSCFIVSYNKALFFFQGKRGGDREESMGLSTRVSINYF